MSLGSPRAARSTSMSRAASRVPTFASTPSPPERCAHRRAYWRFSASVCATPAGDGSTSRSARSATHSASVRQSIAGVLAPTPRGSNPTKSNRCAERAVGELRTERRHHAEPGRAGAAGVEQQRADPLARWPSGAARRRSPSGRRARRSPAAPAGGRTGRCRRRTPRRRRRCWRTACTDPRRASGRRSARARGGGGSPSPRPGLPEVGTVQAVARGREARPRHTAP